MDNAPGANAPKFPSHQDLHAMAAGMSGEHLQQQLGALMAGKANADALVSVYVGQVDQLQKALDAARVEIAQLQARLARRKSA